VGAREAHGVRNSEFLFRIGDRGGHQGVTSFCPQGKGGGVRRESITERKPKSLLEVKSGGEERYPSG